MKSISQLIEKCLIWGEAQGGTPCGALSDRYFGDVLRGEINAKIWKLCNELNLNVLRVGVVWNDIEVEQGVYDFSKLIELAKGYYNNGVTIIWYIDPSPTVAYPQLPFSLESPNNLLTGFGVTRCQNYIKDLQNLETSKFAAFLRECFIQLGRYSPYFMFFNEPDLGSNFQGQKVDENGDILIVNNTYVSWTTADKAPAFVSIYKSIRKVMENVKATYNRPLYLGGASISSWTADGSLFDKILENGILNYIDFMDIHQYTRYGTRSWPAESMIRAFSIFKNKIYPYLGERVLPITIGEFGFSKGQEQYSVSPYTKRAMETRQWLMYMMTSKMFSQIPVVGTMVYILTSANPNLYRGRYSNPSSVNSDSQYAIVETVPNERELDSDFTYNDTPSSTYIKNISNGWVGWEYLKTAFVDENGVILFRSDDVQEDILQGYECDFRGTTERYTVPFKTYSTFGAGGTITITINGTEYVTTVETGDTASEVAIKMMQACNNLLYAGMSGNNMAFKPVTMGEVVSSFEVTGSDNNILTYLGLYSQGVLGELVHTYSAPIYNKGSLGYLYNLLDGNYTEDYTHVMVGTSLDTDGEGSTAIPKVYKDPAWDGGVYHFFEDLEGKLRVIACRVKPWQLDALDVNSAPETDRQAFAFKYSPDINELARTLFPERNIAEVETHVNIREFPLDFRIEE